MDPEKQALLSARLKKMATEVGADIEHRAEVTHMKVRLILRCSYCGMTFAFARSPMLSGESPKHFCMRQDREAPMDELFQRVEV